MEWVFVIIGLILAIPAGYVLRILTSDEINYGRNYFKAIIITSVILALISLLLPLDIVLKKSLFCGFLFVTVVSFMSWWK